MGWRDQAEAYRSDDRQVIESGSSKINVEESQQPGGERHYASDEQGTSAKSEGESIGTVDVHGHHGAEGSGRGIGK